MNSLVSIIVTTHNSSSYLEVCLRTILNQSWKKIEVLVIDDGSVDSTVDIIREFEAKDFRVRFICNPNRGAGLSRNIGIDEANGEYLVFLDSDDFFDEHLIESLLNQAKSSKAQIAVCNYFNYDNVTHASNIGLTLSDIHSSTINTYNEKIKLLRIINHSPWNKIFEKSFIDKNGIKFQDNPHANDTYFVMTSLIMAETIAVLDTPLICYRINQGKSTQDKVAEHPTAILKPIHGLLDLVSNREYSNYADIVITICANLLTFDLFRLRTGKAVDALWAGFCGELRTLRNMQKINLGEWHYGIKQSMVVRAALNNQYEITNSVVYKTVYKMTKNISLSTKLTIAFRSV